VLSRKPGPAELELCEQDFLQFSDIKGKDARPCISLKLLTNIKNHYLMNIRIIIC